MKGYEIWHKIYYLVTIFFYNLCKGFKNRAKLVYFERDLQIPQEIYFMKKVGGKGLHWCYIGESRRKVAEIG